MPKTSRRGFQVIQNAIERTPVALQRLVVVGFWRNRRGTLFFLHTIKLLYNYAKNQQKRNRGE